MKVSKAEFQNMKEEIVKDLISRLMDERGLLWSKLSMLSILHVCLKN